MPKRGKYIKMIKANENVKKLLLLFIGLGIIIAVATFFNSRESSDIKTDSITNNENINIENFTWEQYMALTPEEKMLFPDKFINMDAYNDWYESITPKEELGVPEIELSDKKPEDYTWEDYEKLSIEEKMLFPDYFKSFDAYQEWYDSVSP